MVFANRMSLRVGFLGLGRMGAPMALHVVRAGHDVVVWNRTPEKARALAEAGAAVAATPAQAARDREVVVLMLADPEAVQNVLFGTDGIVGTASPNTLIVDASTIGPQASRRFAAQLAEHELRYVDAPVNGSVAPAQAGTLASVVGGSVKDFQQAKVLIDLWADPDKVRHVGSVGSGSAAKLVRNLTLGLAIAGIGEALRLGERFELTADVVHAAILDGPLGEAFPRIRDLDRNAPANFTIDMLAKDLRLCLDADPKLGLTAGARETATHAQDTGRGADDSRALAWFIREEQIK